MSIRLRLMTRIQHSPYGRFHRRLALMENRSFDEAAFHDACSKKITFFLLVLPLLVAALCFVPQIGVLLSLLVGGLLVRKDLYRYKKANKMKREVARAFPGYINNVIIFLEAGYGMEKALEQSADLGQTNRLKRLMQAAFKQINNGVDREKCLKQVVVTAQDAYVSKFIFVADQGMRLGKNQVMSSLSLLSDKCIKEQLDQMQEDAAKASSKMVFPMMLIFVAIAILAMAPGMITLFTSL